MMNKNAIESLPFGGGPPPLTVDPTGPIFARDINTRPLRTRCMERENETCSNVRGVGEGDARRNINLR